MIILDVFMGIFMGILTGIGIGGGGLLVLYLTAVRELGQLQAQGSNLLFFVFSSVASLYVHNKRRRLDFRLIGNAVAFALAGAIAGSWLAGVLSEDIVRCLYGWMLITAGSVTLLRLALKK